MPFVGATRIVGIAIEWLAQTGCWPIAGKIGVWVSDKLLAPAVVAVVFTGLTNVVLEKRKASRDLATKVVDTLRDDLRTLQTLASDYWSRKRKAGDDAIEARIVSLQTEVTSIITLLADEFAIDVCADEDPTPELLDALTGGSFGQAARSPDLERALKSAKLLSELRNRLIRHRASRLRRTGA